MAGWIGGLFAFVCSQDPLHTWAPGGTLLPFCQRCTGFYAGAAIAMLLQAVLRMRPGTRFLQLHGSFLLLMVPFGFHWLSQGSLLRTVLGLLYGFGVVSFLWLWPGLRLGAVRPETRRRLSLYAVAVAASLLVVPAAAALGSRMSAVVLVALALLGAAGLVALLVANLAIGGAWLFAPHHRGAPRRAS